jgi:hypothetical protein
VDGWRLPVCRPVGGQLPHRNGVLGTSPMLMADRYGPDWTCELGVSRVHLGDQVIEHVYPAGQQLQGPDRKL